PERRQPGPGGLQRRERGFGAQARRPLRRLRKRKAGQGVENRCHRLRPQTEEMKARRETAPVPGPSVSEGPGTSVRGSEGLRPGRRRTVFDHQASFTSSQFISCHQRSTRPRRRVRLEQGASMNEARRREEISASDSRGFSLSAWCVVAAFGTYFCMYA